MHGGHVTTVQTLAYHVHLFSRPFHLKLLQDYLAGLYTLILPSDRAQLGGNVHTHTQRRGVALTYYQAIVLAYCDVIVVVWINVELLYMWYSDGGNNTEKSQYLTYSLDDLKVVLCPSGTVRCRLLILPHCMPYNEEICL